MMTKTEPVARAATGGIAVAGMANPPVPALGAAVRAGRLGAVRRAAADRGVDGVVIAAQGKTVLAGAEIAEA